MAVQVVIPIVGKMGGKYDIVKLVEWKVKEGDQIQQGDIVLAVETKKASCDIEADASGFLYVLVVEGEKAMVGAVAGFIAETREELEELQKTPPWEIAKR